MYCLEIATREREGETATREKGKREFNCCVHSSYSLSGGKVLLLYFCFDAKSMLDISVFRRLVDELGF